MYNIAKLNSKDRKDLFDKYVSDYGGSPAIVEKDFWVTLMLDYLFNKCPYKNGFIFKGGTSLSKCYNIIDRFSEDIDLTIDPIILGKSNKDLYQATTNTSRKKIMKEIKEKLYSFISNKFKPSLENDFKKILGYNPEFKIDDEDPSILNFYYPNVYEPKPSGLLQCIRLEMGAISELTPNEIREVSPLISKINTPILKYKKFNVKTITPVKTFWEKVLILHQEANRPLKHMKDNKEVPYLIPKRYSRHYYDVYRISKTKYIKEAINNIDLLKHLIEFRNKFYPYSWNNIEEAIPGSIVLVPNEIRIKELKADYNSMKEMINDKEIDSFDDLVLKLKKLEKVINNN